MDYNEWMDFLEEKVKNVSKIQASISSFEVLPRLGKVLSDQAATCSECRVYWQQLQDKTVNLDQFFDDGNTYKIEFEKVVNEAMDHLKDMHNMRPKGLVLSLYAVIGMIVGVLLGFVVSSMSVIEVSMKGAVILGWVIGLMLGWFFGKRKERKMRKENKIF